MNIYLKCLITLMLFTSCHPKPVVSIAETLEIGLNSRYSEYVLKLNGAFNGDSTALHEFLTYKNLYDGAAFEHGWILLELMTTMGDKAFADATAKLSKQQLDELSNYLKGGLDIHTEGDQLFKRYPLTFKLLGLNLSE